MIAGKRNMWLLLAWIILANGFGFVEAQESPLERADRAGANPSSPVRKPGGRTARTEKPFSDPRRWVFMAVVAFLAVGGGRKWLAGRRGLRMAGRLAENQATTEEIRAAHKYGRTVSRELFQIMTEGPSAEHRLAATEALVRLWRADELIPEEEKAIVTRALVAEWQIRRKYPRGLTGPIEITAIFGMPPLADLELTEWLARHLRWQYRVSGTRRAADDAWQAAPIAFPRCSIEIMPEDFPEDGPHRLLLHLRVATESLTDNWQIDLPAQSTSFEWDDHLQPKALATLPDSQRAAQWAAAIGFVVSTSDDGAPVFLRLDEQFAIQNPPMPVLKRPLPCDLAHRVVIEFDGLNGRWHAGEWLSVAHWLGDDGDAFYTWPTEATCLAPPATHLHGGTYRMRVVLEPTPERGWSDPLIRSVWPEIIVSGWVDVSVVRV